MPHIDELLGVSTFAAAAMFAAVALQPSLTGAAHAQDTVDTPASVAASVAASMQECINDAAQPRA